MNQNKIKNITYLAVFIIAILAIGFVIAGITAAHIQGWYAIIEYPSFAPPNWLFGPVWSVIYIMIAISGWLVFLKDQLKGKVLGIYIVQLALNFLWSIIFFSYHEISLALLEMTVLWVFIAWNIRIFLSISKVAGYLLVPYILWVSFAWVLNLGFLLSN
jgi:tryptophan-rich sensory protein